MMTTVALDCQDVTDALRRLLGAEIACARYGDGLCLDTPYVVGDGYALRAYLRISDKRILVSDGGFATHRIEGAIHGIASLRNRYRDLQRIAMTSGLHWDGEFSYESGTVDEALLRLKVLAQAMSEANYLIAGHATRPERSIIDELHRGLIERGLHAETNVPIIVPNRDDAVRVDIEVNRDTRKAAVEVLSGQTDSGAIISINQAIANFHALENGHYPGALFGVYDIKSPVSSKRFREQFISAKPQRTILVASDEAANHIAKEFAA